MGRTDDGPAAEVRRTDGRGDGRAVGRAKGADYWTDGRLDGWADERTTSLFNGDIHSLDDATDVIQS